MHSSPTLTKLGQVWYWGDKTDVTVIESIFIVFCPIFLWNNILCSGLFLKDWKHHYFLFLQRQDSIQNKSAKGFTTDGFSSKFHTRINNKLCASFCSFLYTTICLCRIPSSFKTLAELVIYKMRQSKNKFSRKCVSRSV